VIEEVLWEEAQTRRKELESRGETPLCMWDRSVLEKPESAKLEGWGSVRSSRVRRLARSRKGVFRGKLQSRYAPAASPENAQTQREQPRWMVVEEPSKKPPQINSPSHGLDIDIVCIGQQWLNLWQAQSRRTASLSHIRIS
jgi:hypothetical protein